MKAFWTSPVELDASPLIDQYIHRYECFRCEILARLIKHVQIFPSQIRYRTRRLRKISFPTSLYNLSLLKVNLLSLCKHPCTHISGATIYIRYVSIKPQGRGTPSLDSTDRLLAQAQKLLRTYRCRYIDLQSPFSSLKPIVSVISDA